MASSQTKLYALIAIVLVVAAGSFVALMLMQPPPATGPSVQLVPLSGNPENVTLSEMMSMDAVARYGSFQNSYGNVRGQGNYTGVRISDLIELVGGMDEDQVIIVNASDGYSQTFTYSNVYPNESQYAIQGDMVLAYEYNDTLIPDYVDGPRLMFLPEDGYYSNADANLTIDAQFFSGSAGPKIVSNVAQIIIAERPEPDVLQVTVGATTKGYTLSEIIEFGALNGTGGTKNAYGTLKGPYDFTGIAVLDLLSDVATLPDDYNLTVASSDEYTVTYNESTTKGSVNGYDPSTGDPVGIIQCTMLLAYLQEGAPIADGPLRVVFVNEDADFTDSYLWAKLVVNMTVVELEPDILFINRGETSLGYTLTEVMEMPSATGLGGRKSSTGEITGPFTYTGVTMQYLLALSGAPLINYSVEVISTDLYTTYYNKTQVDGLFAAYNASTGDSVGMQNCTLALLYYEGGVPIPSGGPLRVGTLNEDGYVTDGHLWAKFVMNITIVDTVEPWSLELEGVQQWNMTHDTYYSLASCPHHRVSIATGGFNYTGVALWTIVASMDGGDDLHYTFNISLAITGYDVIIYDSEGNNVTFTAAQLAQNASIIVAGWIDGELPDSPEWPLMMVTPDGMFLGNVVRMEMQIYLVDA